MDIKKLLCSAAEVQVPKDIPCGDMPGDKVNIVDGHISQAKKLIPKIAEQLDDVLNKNSFGKAVISIAGGSGVGKSGIASVLAYILNTSGIPCYVMSGDNYPHRIPVENDAERLRLFRQGGIKALRDADLLTSEVKNIIREIQKENNDANPVFKEKYSWFDCYLTGGSEALSGYLGMPLEQDYEDVNRIISSFKQGEEFVWFKRMGRDNTAYYYDKLDMRDVKVLILEWTHATNIEVKGSDIPILLRSTPEETMQYRVARGRDAGADSTFTTMVLGIEQKLLDSSAKRASIILTKDGRIIGFSEYFGEKNIRPMLNAYPDSIGGTLCSIIDTLKKEELKDTFGSFYILPSLYHTDLDRGFSVIDYGLNEDLAKRSDIDDLKDLDIDLKLDFILNHASVLSPQFRDLLKEGEKSKYADFFINWNKFWAGCGQMTDEGYIQPDEEYIKGMFFRKPGLPLLMVKMPDGKKVPYWNTFYQETLSDDAPHKALMEETGVPYLGQMDLNIKNKLVWDFYNQTLKTLASYGAKIVRLDAFAYAPKAPGKKNFLNEPDTWDVLEKVRQLADKYSLTLLPEIHASYSEGIYKQIASKGYMTYDFFLPGLMIYSIEKKDPTLLAKWAKEIIDSNIQTVNMLGCHDGIPLLDLKGLLPEEEIQSLIKLIVSRGGFVKDLHGAKNMYYQVNATYYSALGEDDKKMLLARAIQMFMPGKPQVWYLDLFAGKNDHEGVKRAGKDGHKEINRTNLSSDAIKDALSKDVVKKQLDLLRLRNTHPAFSSDSKIDVSCDGNNLKISWENCRGFAELIADLENVSYGIITK